MSPSWPVGMRDLFPGSCFALLIRDWRLHSSCKFLWKAQQVFQVERSLPASREAGRSQSSGFPSQPWMGWRAWIAERWGFVSLLFVLESSGLRMGEVYGAYLRAAVRRPGRDLFIYLFLARLTREKPTDVFAENKSRAGNASQCTKTTLWCLAINGV